MHRALDHLTGAQADAFLAAYTSEKELGCQVRTLMRELAPEHAAWTEQQDARGEAPPVNAPREAWAAYGMTPPPLPPLGLAQRVLGEAAQASNAIERATRLYLALELLMAEEWPR